MNSKSMGMAVALAVLGACFAAGVQAEEIGKIYGGKCGSCHGKDGKGNPAMAKVFKVEMAELDLVDKASLDKKDAELIELTEKGKGKMPPYKGKLKDSEIKELIAYIRSLAGSK